MENDYLPLIEQKGKFIGVAGGALNVGKDRCLRCTIEYLLSYCSKELAKGPQKLQDRIKEARDQAECNGLGYLDVNSPGVIPCTTPIEQRKPSYGE